MATEQLDYHEFKKYYESLSVGKGFGGVTDSSGLRLFDFLDSASDVLEVVSNYDKTIIGLMATGKALGVATNKLYHICHSPLVETIRFKKDQLPKAVIIEYTAMMVALMYRHSDKREFEKMFNGDE